MPRVKHDRVESNEEKYKRKICAFMMDPAMADKVESVRQSLKLRTRADVVRLALKCFIDDQDDVAWQIASRILIPPKGR